MGKEILSTIVPAGTLVSTMSTVGASGEPWLTNISVFELFEAASLPWAKTDNPNGWLGV